MAVNIAGPLRAQAIDPGVLESVQAALGAAQTASKVAEQASRDAAETEGPTTQVIAPPGGKIDTEEEQEVRRAQARRQLQSLYQPTEIEAEFRGRLSDPTLRQFGYEFFSAGPAPTGIRTGAIGDDYVLGIGDELSVAFRGATNDSRTVRVDRDGMIIVGQLRPIRAAGRSLGALKAELAAETSRTLLATDVFVSVGNVRSISVFVGGEVPRPGQYRLTSLADLVTAIAQAGGVRATGSLRQVRLVRANGQTLMVDLYPYLGIGTPRNIRLQDGDRVIVPVIGPTIGIAGGVARPAIYELRGETSLAAALGYAGGPVRQRGADTVISRIDSAGIETVVRGSSPSARVLPGDAVLVLGSSAGGTLGVVELRGYVDNPGPRPLVSARTVRELVGPRDALRPDTYQLTAILVRADPVTGAREFQPVALSRELRGETSTPLRSQDRLFIFGQPEISFMNSAVVRAIVLGAPNPLPQCGALQRLASVVRDTQSNRFTTVTRGSLVIVDGQSAALGSAARAAGVRDTGALRRNLGDEGQLCPGVFEAEPELLAVLLDNSVSVGGAVRRPGAYPVAGEVSARDLAMVAEGLIPGTTELGLDINRPGAAFVERMVVGPDQVELATTRVSAGDDLRFNGRQPVFEGAGVLLSGEVVRPGLYAIRKGETLSQLLERAGGLTVYAYPYGAVFTRQSVKEAEQQGFQRTAREMNSSLLAITARQPDKAGAENLAGAAALIQLIANAPATGRVVVEADPRVLAVRPDLDTVLEPGDSLFVPKRPNYVLALGDVLNPGALQFVTGKTTSGYLRDAGGTTSTADDGRTYLVLPNGTAQPIQTGLWSNRNQVTPPPGSTIVVPKNIDPLYKLSIAKDIATIIGQLALSVATVAVLADN